MTTTKLTQGQEIKWNLINSALAAGLVFFGAFTTGQISWNVICAAIGAALIVFLTKFKDYWAKEEGEYSTKVFSFLG